MWTEIVSDLAQYDLYEWLILLTGIVYAIFSMLNKPICWVFGIISCALLAYKDFTDYNLLFDGGLQILYVLMGFSGLYNWMRATKDNGIPKIFSMPLMSHINAILQIVLVSLLLVVVMRMFKDPSYATLDSLTTVFSIWATWLLVNRIYETWIYWIIINIVYIYLYYVNGATLVSILYIIYLMTSIGGLFAWKRETETEILVA